MKRTLNLDSLKKSDFSDRGLEGEEMTAVEVDANGFRVSIYFNPKLGYFPIIRDFRGVGRDYELEIFPRLSDVKNTVSALTNH